MNLAKELRARVQFNRATGCETLVLEDLHNRVTSAGTEATCRLSTQGYECEIQYATSSADLRIGYEPFVAGLLGLAMQYGLPIHVLGALDAKFAFGIAEYARQLACRCPDKYRPVPVVSVSQHRQQPGADGALMALSGGIDSLSTMRQLLRDELLPPTHKVRELLFTNVGSHGLGSAGREVYAERLKRLRALAADLGLPVVTVDSNIHDVVLLEDAAYEFRYVEHIASAALALPSRYSAFIFSLELSHADAFEEPDAAPALASHLLGSEGVHIHGYGGHLRRPEKLQLISDWDIAHKHLNVCVRPSATASNCGSCPKCVRAMVTLDVLGVLPTFADVFPTSEFSRLRDWYFSEPFDDAENFYRWEIREFARARGLPVG